MVVRSSKDIAMTLPVTVDPRYHDAVIFNLDAVLTDNDGVGCRVDDQAGAEITRRRGRDGGLLVAPERSTALESRWD